MVGSAVGGCGGTEDTLGGFDIIGPLDVKLGEGLGTGIIAPPVLASESVGVGGICDPPPPLVRLVIWLNIPNGD